MPALLNAASEEELADLSAWLADHPTDADENLRWEAESWVVDVIEATEAYPAFIAVPEHLIPILNDVIDDWSELLTAHDEDFLTELQVL